MARWTWLGTLAIVAAVGCGTTNTGSTTGTTTGSPNTALVAGAACTANAQCQSQVCGLNGTGNCCTSQCTADGTTCGVTSCDTSGACVKAYAGANCDSCTGSAFTPGSCDGHGACETGIAEPCPGNLSCSSSGTTCSTNCAKNTDCGTGFWCDTSSPGAPGDAGVCTATLPFGACTSNAACTSGICGISGTGHCCNSACTDTTAPCGATDCAADGTCVFAAAGTSCGSTASSCSAGIQNNPSVCDGQGNCPTPGTTDCAPYLCGANACLSGCVDTTSCKSGSFCDTLNSACCDPIASGGTLTVDSVNGSDALGCCGIGANQPCQTITHAMRVIELTQAENVTLQVTVKGLGGDWTPAGEHYPIVLGWGVELNAPGVYFRHPKGTGAVGTFLVTKYSLADSLASASIVGTTQANVGIGMNKSGGMQSTALSAVQVDPDATFYVANAYLNGNATQQTNAITIMPGGTLVLATDESGGVTGTVNIGNGANIQGTDGFDGIFCRSDNVSRGCTVREGANTGINSLIIKGQEASTIVANDFSNISLVGTPIFGVAPGTVGFGECAYKPDGTALLYPASIYLHGKVTMLLRNATITCISANAIALAGTRNGVPDLTLDKTTISNVETALAVGAGNATVSNSTFQFNYTGASQAQDAGLDLSGGNDAGTNTIICNSNQESIFGNFTLPGVAVLNTSKLPLNAADVAWDTPGPDQFLCNNMLANCTCLNGTCAGPPNVNGMDAVTESGPILTSGNTVSQLATKRGCK